MSQVVDMSESCRRYKWVMLCVWMRHDAYQWVMSHLIAACHTYEWAMSQIWMNHIAPVNEAWRASISHVTHVNGRCHPTTKIYAWLLRNSFTHIRARAHTHTHIFTHTHTRIYYRLSFFWTQKQYEWLHLNELYLQIYESHYTFQGAMSLVWMSLSAHTIESR